MGSTHTELGKLIDDTLTRDHFQFRRRLRTIQRSAGSNHPNVSLEKLRADIAASVDQVAKRASRIPAVEYDTPLPVVERQDEIKTLIEKNQVIILCGETGSGKTTQLPKMLLEIGRGVRGQIAHTQPRRIAARTVAHRIAAELGTDLGDIVGYKVRFSDKSDPRNLIKLMTDGVLLAETQSDRFLDTYDTIVIDEAHERNLNVDFLFGYLKKLLKKRHDLKLIITSATIDSEKFSAHFGNAPVIEVSGRTYPVDIQYVDEQSLEAEKRDSIEDDLLISSLSRIEAHGGQGDVLIFLPGEREIKSGLELIRRSFLSGGRAKFWELLPLFSRLSPTEQNKIFTRQERRRIILATNIAETSLTIPNIQFVIDTGLARIKRYSYRNKVEMLQTERVSQASANQRAGRSGRVMNGVCIRLYSESDFESRPIHPDPEILRSSLAAVILKMESLGLKDPSSFPFVDSPIPRAITDGYQLLEELGAIDPIKQLTRLGTELARLPLDPRVGRMVLASRENGCTDEVLKLAAGFSVPDVRDNSFYGDVQNDVEPPKREKSDFDLMLDVWEWFQGEFEKKQGKRRLKEACQKRHISVARMFEWRELYQQLKSTAKNIGIPIGSGSSRKEDVIRSVLSGLLGNIGYLIDKDGTYIGARGIKFQIHPSSNLKKKKPKWIVAMELVETQRLYARGVASIDVTWIEPIAKHLTRSTYREPRWSKNLGSVVADEQVTLYGLVIVASRQVQYGPIAPSDAREIFIRDALVHGHVKKSPPFMVHNQELIEAVSSIEERVRRYDLLVDEGIIHSFFDERVPKDINTWTQFEQWRKSVERVDPKILYLKKSLLIRREVDEGTYDLYPDEVEINGIHFQLSYRFEPGHPLDGVTLAAPIELLNQVHEQTTEWLVPGLLREKITELVKALPKVVRKQLFPVNQFVDAVVGDLRQKKISLYEHIASVLKHRHNITVPIGDLLNLVIPKHLMMNFSILDEAGVEIKCGRNLSELKRELGSKAKDAFSTQEENVGQKIGLKSWNFGDLPDAVTVTVNGRRATGYPALRDDGDSVSMVFLDVEMDARRMSLSGLQRLFRLSAKEQFKFVEKQLSSIVSRALQYSVLLRQHGVILQGSSVQDRLMELLLQSVANRALSLPQNTIKTQAEFLEKTRKAKTDLVTIANELSKLTEAIFDQYATVMTGIEEKKKVLEPSCRSAINDHLLQLMSADFLRDTPYEYLRHYPRYLSSIMFRIEKAIADPHKDLMWQEEIDAISNRIRIGLDRCRDASQIELLSKLKWSIEELRVSLWAQQLKTPKPVSFKRIEKALDPILKAV